jgi:DNA-binding PadR family transcriptional regulator
MEGGRMSIGMSLLAILQEAPTYGLHIKNEFESRTGAMWPLNVGQVYGTLARYERDGLVRALQEGPEGQKIYEITDAGRERLRSWFEAPMQTLPPARDELVLKLIMALGLPGANPQDVIQAERRSAVELLQELTLLKRNQSSERELSWAVLLESLIFQTEARVRWLDDCETRLQRQGIPSTDAGASLRSPNVQETSELSR